MNMALQLGIATCMVLLTVLIHGGGIYALAGLIQPAMQRHHAAHGHPLSPRSIATTIALVLGLFAIHGVEIWAYAALYYFTGALPDLHQSVYFSTITYATIGYDDEGIARAWQLVAAIEGVNGILLLGWSTAFFVTMMGRMARR